FTDKPGMLRESPIGLQLHSNRRPQEFLFRGLVLSRDPEDRLVTAEDAPAPNTLSAPEKKAGFELLFDGKGLDGWESKGNWKVQDGAIARAGKGGGLTYKTKKVPDNFELRFEWKVAKGSNSGVYYRPGQYEYQVLDNQHHADGKNPRTSAAS